MFNQFSKMFKSIKNEFEYFYLLKLSPEKYEKYLSKQYKKKTGEDLNIISPESFSEKIQYSKLHLVDPEKTRLTDKYLVREWVNEKIGSEYLIPLLGAWDKSSDIEIENLPEKFVLKTNHSAGWNIIVKDKQNFNFSWAKMKIRRWLNRNFAYYSDLQLQYRDIKPKILAETYLVDSEGQLNDYKFICFNGKPYYCWIDIGRHTNHYRNLYDMEWNLQNWSYNTFDRYPEKVEKPTNFDKMVELATTLSKGFSHVRVDLYNVDGQIFFGEMTFTSSGGYTLTEPKEYNYYLGSLWDISG